MILVAKPGTIFDGSDMLPERRLRDRNAEVAGGEGVFRLHVASLWKPDDRGTAAPMRLFYNKLFRENKPPLAALRKAQLAIYHNPDEVAKLASARALEFG